jgi:hypothetical protein
MRGLFVALILASLLVFGCVGEEAVVEEGDTVTEETGEIGDTTEETTEETVETGDSECEPSYMVLELGAGIFSKGTPFGVSAECAGGKTVSLYVDSEKIAEQQVATNDVAVLNFVLIPKSEGAKTVEVKVDGETVYSTSWPVIPLGSQDISGSKNEDVSSRKWVAISYHVDSRVQVKSVGAYMKRLYSNTLEDTYVVAEIRPDNNGEPGDEVLASSRLLIDETTMTENWIWFNFEEPVELAPPGRNWVVFRIDYPDIVSDVVNIHYVGEDTTSEPNEYTMRKLLEWDDDEREFVETTGWETFTYNKEFSVVLSGLEH